MAVYFSLIILVTIFMSVAQVEKQNGVLSRIFILFTFLSLVFVAGFRSSNVGTDTNSYVTSFNSYQTQHVNVFEIETSREIGYLVIEKVARKLHNEYWILLVLIAIISVYYNLRVIIKLSQGYSVSIFIFIALGAYLFMFNGARQSLAASFYGMAVVAMMNGKFKKYLFWVVVAALFHKTVLITLPLYYFFRKKYSFKNLLLNILASIILISSLGFILRLFPESLSRKYIVYEDRGATGAELLTVFYIVLTLVFIAIRKFIKKTDIERYDIYLNMAIFNSLIYALVYLMKLDVNMIRISLYLYFGFMLIWPIIFINLEIFKSMFIRLVFYAVHLIFFYIYISKMSNLLPYQFNPYF